MFAFEIPNQRFSLPAGMDVERYRFVAVDANSNGIIADEMMFGAVGVSMNQAAAGEVLEIADGIVMVEAGNAVEPGMPVVTDTDGRAIPGGEAPVCVAIAITGATAAGELITVKL